MTISCAIHNCHDNQQVSGVVCKVCRIGYQCGQLHVTLLMATSSNPIMVLLLENTIESKINIIIYLEVLL